MIRACVEIVRKDIEGNARAVMLLLVAVVGLAFLMPSIKTGGGPPGNELVFLGNLNLVGAVAIAQWVVGAERQRKTMVILKILPVSPRAVVIAKFCSSFIMQETIFALSLVSMSLAVHSFPGSPVMSPYGLLVLINFSLLAFLSTMLFTSFLFKPKTAVMLPLLVLFLLSLAVVKVGKAASFFQMLWFSSLGQLVLPFALVGVVFLSAALSTLRFERADPNTLVTE